MPDPVYKFLAQAIVSSSPPHHAARDDLLPETRSAPAGRRRHGTRRRRAGWPTPATVLALPCATCTVAALPSLRKQFDPELHVSAKTVSVLSELVSALRPAGAARPRSPVLRNPRHEADIGNSCRWSISVPTSFTAVISGDELSGMPRKEVE